MKRKIKKIKRSLRFLWYYFKDPIFRSYIELQEPVDAYNDLLKKQTEMYAHFLGIPIVIDESFDPGEWAIRNFGYGIDFAKDKDRTIISSHNMSS